MAAGNKQRLATLHAVGRGLALGAQVATRSALASGVSWVLVCQPRAARQCCAWGRIWVVQLGGNYEFTLQALKELTYLLATVWLL